MQVDMEVTEMNMKGCVVRVMQILVIASNQVSKPFWQFFIKTDKEIFDPCMQIKIFLVQMYSFEVVNNSLL